MSLNLGQDTNDSNINYIKVSFYIHFKSEHFYRVHPQTRVWGEQWMTFLSNPYVNTRCGQYALSYRLLISAYVTVATCLS